QLKSIGQQLTIIAGNVLGDSFAGLKILASKDENKQIGENAKAQEEALLRTRYLATPPPAASTGRDFSEPPGEGEAGETDDEGRATGKGVKESSDLDVIGADNDSKLEAAL